VLREAWRTRGDLAGPGRPTPVERAKQRGMATAHMVLACCRCLVASSPPRSEPRTALIVQEFEPSTSGRTSHAHHGHQPPDVGRRESGSGRPRRGSPRTPPPEGDRRQPQRSCGIGCDCRGGSGVDLDQQLRVAAEASFLRVRHVATRESPALVRNLVGHSSCVLGCAGTADGRHEASAPDGELPRLKVRAGVDTAQLVLAAATDLP
jgi:hypothetical protein